LRLFRGETHLSIFCGLQSSQDLNFFESIKFSKKITFLVLELVDCSEISCILVVLIYKTTRWKVY
jgi:hypothetical protein